MNIILRDARQNDYESVKRLFSQLAAYHDGLYGDDPDPNREDLTPEDFAKELSQPKSKMLLAVDLNNDGKVAGLIHADWHNLTEDPLAPTDRMVRIMSINIDEPYRGQKLGKTMIAAIEQWSTDIGAGLVQLRVDKKNFNAAAAYQKLDYVLKTEPVGKLDFMKPYPYSDLMIKPLTPKLN